MLIHIMRIVLFFVYSVVITLQISYDHIKNTQIIAQLILTPSTQRLVRKSASVMVRT